MLSFLKGYQRIRYQRLQNYQDGRERKRNQAKAKGDRRLGKGGKASDTFYYDILETKFFEMTAFF